MTELLDKKKIRQVFRKVQKHRLIEQLIRQFSTNKEDIRKKALTQSDLSFCNNVLELGCAFGSFTESLKDRLHPAARINGLDIVPEYKPFFLDACKRAGYAGTFSSSGINHIKKYSTASFDLVICSFALYFFAGMIPEIARILKKDGIFIAITHYQSNMQELIAITKKILEKNELQNGDELLPIEVIVRQFSAENGRELLTGSFGRVIPIDFKNKLIFHSHEINFFIEYFHFKSPFFLIGTNTDSKIIVDELILELQNIMAKKKVITMCKDDRIFICSQPLITKEKA
ncbi:MAG: class I SAM-dependent methyltransferase [Smithellaceae bacterium]